MSLMDDFESLVREREEENYRYGFNDCKIEYYEKIKKVLKENIKDFDLYNRLITSLKPNEEYYTKI